ncbi:hypothetical protein HZH68_006457 [Vespula germanica]|uniref:Uncharacterized protein n=1 Tax=Vespula germanica TaxID=30212 RepID=A0A834KBJ6_VESGE|nr:hypothetical protein HZH68_006457 [Vespula germanica]
MNRFKNSMQKFAGSELSALWAPIWLTKPMIHVCAACCKEQHHTSNEIHMILDKSSIRLKTIQNVIAQKWPVSGQAWSLVGRYADTTFAPTTTES